MKQGWENHAAQNSKSCSFILLDGESEGDAGLFFCNQPQIANNV